MVRTKLFFIFCCLSSWVSAQNDSVWQLKPTLELSGFVDAYYVYDFNQPTEIERQGFLFNHNRHNDFSINLGLMKLALKHEKYRANLALQVGTYVTDNYKSEPSTLKNIHEASVGISLSKKNKLWIDLGVLPSYLGFESAVSSENYTLTRSLVAENSPYYVSGAKMTYKPNSNWEMALLVMNGWQRIQRLKGNSLPSFGTQVAYHFKNKNILNWGTFVGTAYPDFNRKMRYFSNLYGKFALAPRLNFIAGFDAGIEEASPFETTFYEWYGLDAILQYKVSSNWKLGIRSEYYHDPYQVIIKTGTLDGFQTYSSSLNVDYVPLPNVMWRVEARWMNSYDKIFVKNQTKVKQNFFIGTSLAIKFGKELH